MNTKRRAHGVHLNGHRNGSPSSVPPAAMRCRRKFLHYFPGGFADETYYDWERGYKWEAHLAWEETLNQPNWRRLLRAGNYTEIAATAIRIESRTNLLFSFEKMALRDAVKSVAGATLFSQGLYELLYGRGAMESRFERWCETVGALPRKQTRVLTWPVVTVVPFIAQPDQHMFVKPVVTRNAADAYGFDFEYASKPNWNTYASILAFAEKVQCDQKPLKPKDMIDLQSFIWVQGSDEYE